MMAANYRHIGGGVNRLGRHYSRFSGFWPMASVVDQSLALRKSQNRESNRRRRVNSSRRLAAQRDPVIANDVDAHGWILLNKPAPLHRRPTHALFGGQSQSFPDNL